MSISLANSLTLPDDAVTQTFAFLGRKGSGKTYAAGRLVEQLLGNQTQTVVLDPVGNWYGLRLSRSGKRPSKLSLPIIGGEFGDIPLEQGAGQVVANFVVDTGSSCVLDVSLFRKGERKEFVAQFAECLFHRKKTDRSPLHLVIEEAQVFAPQMSKGQERMLGAIEDIVRLGRNYGIGSSMISQRPQSVNKEILNQAEPLVVFQLVGKHERDALRGWIVENADSPDATLFAGDLPSLETGECFFWSPAWMRTFKRIRIAQKSTFDASSTPKAGDKSPGRLAPVDLAALIQSMLETIERARSEDPKALRAEIAQLRKQLADKTPSADVIEREIEKNNRHWRAQLRDVQKSHERLCSKLEQIKELATANGSALVITAPGSQLSAKGSESVAAPPRSRPAIAESTPVPETRLGKAEAKILRAFWWLHGEEATRTKVAFYSGYRAGSGSFNNALGKLRSAGLLDGWRITPAGAAVASIDADPKPTGPELREWLRGKLSKAENALLDALVERWPERVSNAELSEATGYAVGSGSFNNALGRLRSLEAAVGTARTGGTSASDLFSGAVR